jgi:hypothetical protein
MTIAISRRLALALVVASQLASSGCDALTGASNIEYTVTGPSSTRVSITYQSSSDGSSQVSRAALPWSYSWKADRGDFLYVSAQIVEGGGTVIASIYKDGDLVDSGQASGFAAIATASGTNDD